MKKLSHIFSPFLSSMASSKDKILELADYPEAL